MKKRSTLFSLLTIVVLAFAMTNFSVVDICAAYATDISAIFDGESDWSLANLVGDTFEAVNGGVTEGSFTYPTTQTESGKYVKLNEEAFTYNGILLKNDSSSSLAYCYTAPEDGTYFVKDMAQVAPQNWWNPLPERAIQATYKVVKVSGKTVTNIFPTDDSYRELGSEYAKMDSVRIKERIELVRGDKLYFINGMSGGLLFSSPEISREEFADSYEFRDYWRKNQYLDRSVFDVVYIDNTAGGTGTAYPFRELDNVKTEWGIDGTQGNRAFAWWNNGVSYVGAWGGDWIHAGVNAGEDIAYRFTAPKSGRVSIKLETETASPVPNIVINLNGSKIWPTDRDAQPVFNLGTVVMNDYVSLNEGDTLDFVLLGQTGGSLKTYLNPTIGYDSFPAIKGEGAICVEDEGRRSVSVETVNIDAEELVWSSNNPFVTVTHDETAPEKAVIEAMSGIEERNAIVTVSGGGETFDFAVIVYEPIAVEDGEEQIFDVDENLEDGIYEVLYSGRVYLTFTLDNDVSVKITKGDDVVSDSDNAGYNLSGVFTVSKGERLMVTDSDGNAVSCGDIYLKYIFIDKFEEDRIFLSEKNVFMKIGEEKTLNYTVTPASSSEKNVAFI
ncbi:MAG: hypothetical protein ACI4S9_06325, partial [Christensenellales bacterium]